MGGSQVTWDVIKLALLGFRHPVEVWGFCPPAWNDPWLLIGVLRDTTSRSLALRMAFWRLRRPWEQN